MAWLSSTIDAAIKLGSWIVNTGIAISEHSVILTLCFCCVVLMCLVALIQLVDFILKVGIWFVRGITKRLASRPIQDNATTPTALVGLMNDVSAMRSEFSSLQSNMSVAIEQFRAMPMQVLNTIAPVITDISGVMQALASQRNTKDSGSRYFYLSYMIVIDHDRNAEEFGIPGMETIKRGTITRPGCMVLCAADGILNPAAVRLFLMRFVSSHITPEGLFPPPLLVQTMEDITSYGSLGSDGEFTVRELLDLVIISLFEITETDYRNHLTFSNQMRLHGRDTGEAPAGIQ